MVKSIRKAKRIQVKRHSAGKTGIAAAVRRFLKRERLTIDALK